MSRLASVFGPTFVTFAVFYLFHEVVRVASKLFGIVTDPHDLVDKMNVRLYRDRFVSDLITWCRGGK